MMTLQEFVSDQLTALNELGDELREWYDNSPEGLQASDKMQAVESAADVLSYLETPDFPEDLQDLDVTQHPQWKTPKSKRDRLAYHTNALRWVADWIRDHIITGDEEPEELAEAIEGAAEEADGAWE